MKEVDPESLKAEIIRGEELLAALAVKRDAAHATWERAQLALQYGTGATDAVLSTAGVYYYWRRQCEEVRGILEHNLIVYAGRTGLLPKVTEAGHEQD